ncbi:hypothetical protein Srufu_027000 [Streptomyces libani subsp. rufus]|nr:hypothetical protein Srufu_027000 [Streptomyces libani subsp. rufus]
MRIGLLTEGGYPDAVGESHAWCDRLVRGLTGHDFEVYALSTDPRQEARPRTALPEHVRLVRRAPCGATSPPGADGPPRSARAVAPAAANGAASPSGSAIS